MNSKKYKVKSCIQKYLAQFSQESTEIPQLLSTKRSEITNTNYGFIVSKFRFHDL